MSRRPRLIPVKKYNFRIIGYNPEGEIQDFDDTMLEWMAINVAKTMLRGSSRYRQPITKVEIRDKKGEIRTVLEQKDIFFARKWIKEYYPLLPIER